MASSRPDDRYRHRHPTRRVVVVEGDGAHSFSIRPWLLGAAVVLGAALSVAYLGATAYLIYRDDLLETAFSRNADMQQAYEDRIATLRAEIDKIASRQILDQVAFDEKMERLLAAQRAIDGRQQVVNTLVERAKASGLLADTTAPAVAAPLPPEKRADIDPIVTGTTTAYAADARTAEIENRFAALTDFPSTEADSRIETAEDLPLDAEGKPDLRRLVSRLDSIDQQQTAVVQAIADAAEERVETATDIIGDLGIRVKLAADSAPETDTATGGPYIPLEDRPLGAALAEAETAFDRLTRLKTVLGRLPVGAPIPGATLTSNFGSRSDPFLGSAAFHAGIDFRSPTGKPVGAAAAGTVVEAGRHGGYGNLVEIDHGKGLTTRYAHLSKIDVKVGEAVTAGQTIGRVGSTGRSTGPHLHYETRMNGEPVNPSSFLKAGKRLASLLR